MWPVLGLFLLTFSVLTMFFSGVWVLSFIFFASQIMEFSMTFILDFFSSVFLVTVLLISVSVFVFSQYYMDSEKNLKGFIVLLSLFVSSMVFLIVSPNLLFLLLGWDGLGVTSYLLVVFYLNYSSSVAGMVTFLINRLGDVFFLLALSFFSFVLDWNFFEQKTSFFILAVLLMFSFITKSAQIPFSSWLPAAMAAPTPVSSLVHSSTLVTAGVFLLIRFSSMILPSTKYLIIVATLTILMAGVMASMDWDLKKVIAFSTLSQLGFMVTSYSCGLVVFCFFHLITHAFFKASLFMCSGVLIHSNDSSQEYRGLKSVAKVFPFVSVCVFVCLLCLCGFPFSSGFFSKDLVLDGGIIGGFVFLLFLAGVLLTFSYSFRFGLYTLNKKVWARFSSFSAGDTISYLFYPIFFLVAVALVFGFIATELFFMDLTVFVILSKGWKACYWLMVITFSGLSLLMFQDYLLTLKSYFLKQMWHLNQMFSQLTGSKMLKKSSSLLKNLDHGWWEIFSAGGAKSVSFLSSFLFLQHYFFFFFSFILFVLFLF